MNVVFQQADRCYLMTIIQLSSVQQTGMCCMMITRDTDAEFWCEGCYIKEVLHVQITEESFPTKGLVDRNWLIVVIANFYIAAKLPKIFGRFRHCCHWLTVTYLNKNNKMRKIWKKFHFLISDEALSVVGRKKKALIDFAVRFFFIWE